MPASGVEYMYSFTEPLNFILGISAIILQILCVFALTLLIFGPKQNKFLHFIKDNFLLLGFVMSLLATGFSLFYSNVLHYAPCYLCWWQRIFIFPQVVLFGMAYFKNDTKIARYSFPLLFIGTLFSLYQNFIYYFGESSAPCDASGVSCTQRLVSEIGGYISIPMLCLTSFAVLIILLLVARFYNKES